MRTVRFLTLIVFPLIAGAQSELQLGVLPAVNLHRKINADWSVNGRFESRHQFTLVTSDQPAVVAYNYRLSDVSLIASRKVGVQHRIAAGYLLRLENGLFIHRSIQQYTYLQSLRSMRLAHRLMADQTFGTTSAPIFRLRYRITSEIPLSGAVLDSREFYIKLNVEQLSSWQSTQYELELRGVPLLGYQINPLFKTEVGIDYRINRFLKGEPQQRLWLAINLFLEW